MLLSGTRMIRTMRVLVVINPRSGRYLKKPAAQHLETLLKDAANTRSFEYHILLMPGNDAQNVIAEKIRTYKPDVVAGAGGDGTINLLSKLLAHTETALLIIPLGSANGMAKELAINTKAEQAIELLHKGIVKKIDLLNINGRICIHLADVGLNARVVKRFEQDTRRGLLTYAKHLWRELFLIRQYKFYIKADDKEMSRKAVSLTFANASRYGTGAVINPSGIIDDGKFELVVVRPFPPMTLLSITWKMFTGKLQTSEYVEVISCNSAFIRSSKKTILQIDGEVIGRTREITIRILKKALNVIVPNDAL